MLNKILSDLKRTAHDLWNDQRGTTGLMGLILLTAIVSIGVVVGLSTYRGHVLQQFGDASVALRSLRQSYSYEIQIDANNNNVFGEPEDCVLTGSFTDTVDLADAAGSAPAGIDVSIAPTNES